MGLSILQKKYHVVRRGQTLAQIARNYKCTPVFLASVNALSCEVEEGQVLLLPQEGRNLYTVRGGESKTILCGSPARYEQLNGTSAFFPGQTVRIG